LKQKIKETLTLLRTETFLKRDILRALRAATTKFADNVTEEKAIAEALYKKMVKKGG
jgi:hypothetical protein